MTTAEKITKVEKVLIVGIGLAAGFCFMNRGHAATVGSHPVSLSQMAETLTEQASPTADNPVRASLGHAR